jgi:hypothetical protein
MQTQIETKQNKILAAPFSENSKPEFKLSQTEKTGLETLILVLKDHELNEPTVFLKTAERLCPILFPLLQQKLNALKSTEEDLVFLENIPFFADEQSTRTLSLLIACMTGSPFQFEQQNGGELVARISPEPGLENTNSSSGRMKFGWHSDDSVLDERFRPDFLLLAGHHNPTQVRTFVSSLQSIQKCMNPDLFFELMKPLYALGLPASFKLGSNARLSNSPLIWFDGSRKLNIAFSEYNAKAETMAGTRALSALLEATEECSTSFNLQPGNMLIFRNNRVLHARGQINGDRTIFRVYVKESLSHLRRVAHHHNFIFDLNSLMNEIKFQN